MEPPNSPPLHQRHNSQTSSKEEKSMSDEGQQGTREEGVGGSGQKDLKDLSRDGFVREDFVLCSEFSEQEGPVPFMSFPESALSEVTGFDIPKFVIRIMAVDNQVHTGFHFFLSPY